MVVAAILGLSFNLARRLSADVGTEGASFLDIPVGAGPAALGGAYTARAIDVYGMVWNPAGLGRVQGVQVAAQHLEYLESIHYEYAGTAVAIRPGTTFGGGVQYLGSGDIQGTDNFGSPTRQFSSHYAAYSLSFGQALGQAWSLGFTSKWIEAQLNDAHAHAFAGDIGSLYRPSDQWAFALSAANLGSSLTFIDQKDPLPMIFRTGVYYNPVNHWNLSIDSDYRRSGLASVHTGLEWRPIPSLALRVGYRTDTLKDLSPLAGFSTGIGVKIYGQELAYAWLPMGELGNSQYLSLLLKFGQPSEEDRKNLVYLPDIHRNRNTWAMPATLREQPRTEEDRELVELLSSEKSSLVKTISAGADR